MANLTDDPAVPLAGMPARIERGNLHDEVVAVLRERIIQDELSPGTRIQEAELCEQFGISRTPLREAIRVRVAEGLVTLLPRRGAVVATPTQDEIQGLFYALGAIESVCAPIACENFTADDIAFIEREHVAMLDHQANGRIKDYYRANQAIHDSIVRGAHNQFLIAQHRSLGIRITRDRFFIEITDAAWRRSLGEHERILELVQQRDGLGLAAMMQQHMIGSWKDFDAGYNRPKPAAKAVSVRS